MVSQPMIDHAIESVKKGGRLRRFGRGLMQLAFPSLWISSWAERKHKQIENPALARLVEGFTYRKAYGFDEIKEHMQSLRDMKAQQAERRKATVSLDAEEAYRVMMHRHGYSESDRERGMKNLRREIRIAQVLMGAALVFVMVGAWHVSWPTVIMAALSFAYAWLKGMQSAFYLWQSEQRACRAFGVFRRQGGVFKVFEW